MPRARRLVLAVGCLLLAAETFFPPCIKVDTATGAVSQLNDVIPISCDYSQTLIINWSRLVAWWAITIFGFGFLYFVLPGVNEPEPDTEGHA